MLSDLILRQIADAVTAQYAPDEVAEFLAEEGIPPAQLILPDGIAEGDAHAVLAAPSPSLRPIPGTGRYRTADRPLRRHGAAGCPANAGS